MSRVRVGDRVRVNFRSRTFVGFVVATGGAWIRVRLDDRCRKGGCETVQQRGSVEAVG